MQVERVLMKKTLKSGKQIWPEGEIFESPLPPEILSEVERERDTVEVLGSVPDSVESKVKVFVPEGKVKVSASESKTKVFVPEFQDKIANEPRTATTIKLVKPKISKLVKRK